MKQWITLATTDNSGCLLSTDSFILQSPDTRRWCNSMFSNNIRKLQPSQGNLSAICDDRGRMQGLIDVYCLDDNQFLCVLQGISLDWFQQRFSMYMMLDDIELEPLATQIFHICGPNASHILEQAGFPTPSEDKKHHGVTQMHIVQKNRFGVDGFDIIAEDLQTVIEKLQAVGLHLGTEQAFDALRIVNGVAKWPDDGTDKTMIHELNYQAQCCAFDKGCYVGQEIINRIDVKGLINKKIHRLSIDGSATIGDTLSLQGQKVGIISSLVDLSDSTIALSVIKKSAWSSGTVLQLSSGGSATVL